MSIYDSRGRKSRFVHLNQGEPPPRVLKIGARVISNQGSQSGFQDTSSSHGASSNDDSSSGAAVALAIAVIACM